MDAAGCPRAVTEARPTERKMVGSPRASANGDRRDSTDDGREGGQDAAMFRESNPRARRQTSFFSAEQSGAGQPIESRRTPPVKKERVKTPRNDSNAKEYDNNVSPECSDIDRPLSPPWETCTNVGESDLASEFPLRNSWELAAIYHFFVAFGASVDVDADGFDLAELEYDLCRPDASTSALLANLHLPLLKSTMKGIRIAKQPLSPENWSIGLSK